MDMFSVLFDLEIMKELWYLYASFVVFTIVCVGIIIDIIAENW